MGDSQYPENPGTSMRQNHKARLPKHGPGLALRPPETTIPMQSLPGDSRQQENQGTATRDILIPFTAKNHSDGNVSAGGLVIKRTGTGVDTPRNEAIIATETIPAQIKLLLAQPTAPPVVANNRILARVRLYKSMQISPHTPILSTQNLSLHFDEGQTRALDGVDIAIAEGELSRSTGPSGCGKVQPAEPDRTLDTPTSGDIHFRAQPYSALGDLSLFRRENIGFIFPVVPPAADPVRTGQRAGADDRPHRRVRRSRRARPCAVVQARAVQQAGPLPRPDVRRRSASASPSRAR